MKKTLFISLLLGLNMIAFPQLDNIDFLKGGVKDANLLFQEYLTPVANILGANLNGGWYNSARPHKIGGFDITITASAAMAPTSDGIFNLNNLPLSNDASINGPHTSPTITGDKTQIRPEIVYTKTIPNVGDYVYAKYTLPDGTGMNILPLPMVQLGLGLPFGTEITGRYLPDISLGSAGKIGLWGIGVKHSISQHIPVIKKIPFLDITAQGAYTKLKTFANIEYNPSDIAINGTPAHDYVNDPNQWLDQKIELGVTAWMANILVSETFPIISFYQGIGISSSGVNLGLKGNFPFATIETNPGAYYLQPVIKNDATGKIKNPINLDMQSNKNLRLNAGLRLKLGFLTIHADYTKANYTVVTAGLGISIR